MTFESKYNENPFRPPEIVTTPTVNKSLVANQESALRFLVPYGVGFWIAMVLMAAVDATSTMWFGMGPAFFADWFSVVQFALTFCLAITLGIGMIVSICVRARFGTARNRLVNRSSSVMLGLLTPPFSLLFLWSSWHYMGDNFVFVATPGVITIILVSAELAYATAHQVTNSAN